MVPEKKLKTEIIELKKTLNTLNVEKEEWFTKKESLKKDVANLISQIKKIKFSKDKDNKETQKLKAIREKHNNEVKKLIAKFKKLNEEKLKIMKDKKITFDPAQLVKRIDELDYSVETEALSFDKEKKIMTQIRQLKKQLEEASEVQGLFKELKVVSNQIKETKDKAEEAHKKLQEIKKDQNTYEEFMKLTKQINELKKKQEDAFSKFIDSKNKFSGINKQLKEKLKDAKDINLKETIKVENKQAKVLEQKTKEVEEKLKKKKKLTTEDLLVFQGTSKK